MAAPARPGGFALESAAADCAGHVAELRDRLKAPDPGRIGVAAWRRGMSLQAHHSDAGGNGPERGR